MGYRGRAPCNKYDVLTLPKIALPQINPNKSRSLKRTVLLMTNQFSMFILKEL